MQHPQVRRAAFARVTPRTTARALGATTLPLLLSLASMPALAAGAGCDALFTNGFDDGEVATPPRVCLTAPFNDTGITACGAAASGLNAACNAGEPAGQDANYGRDAVAATGTLFKVGAGSAGFDFTKISNAGAVLPATATLGAGPNDWACTRDNVTGLVWEVKLDQPNQARHGGYNYTWFEPTTPDGNAGDAGSTATCSATLGAEPCNTTNYRTYVNTVGLCGANDWRLPKATELEGLVDYSRAAPAIDPTYFPNTSGFAFWTGSPRASVNFGSVSPASMYVHVDGTVSFSIRANAFRVRLVRIPATPAAGASQ